MSIQFLVKALSQKVVCLRFEWRNENYSNGMPVYKMEYEYKYPPKYCSFTKENYCLNADA